MSSGRGQSEISDLPLIEVGRHADVVAAFRADPLYFFSDAHAQCGPVARAWFDGGDVVVLSGLEANQFVFADADRWDYEASAAIFADQFGPTYLTALNGEAHLTKRRQMAGGFRASIMTANSALLADEAQSLLRSLDGTRNDLRTLAQRLVVHMSGRAVLGRPLPAQLATDIATVERHLLSAFGVGSAPADHFEEPVYLERKASLVAQLEEIITSRSWQQGTAETVLESLVEDADGQTAAMQEVVADLFLLLSAGSETTSAAITWGLLFLAANPAWAERLRVDLQGWKSGDELDARNHPSLLATVIETERMRPPLPLHVKVAAQDLTFLNTSIKAGTRVLHAACVTHRLADVFPDPDSWKPERFLEGTRHLPPRCLGTFGGTTHVCLGLPLARLEQMVALAVVSTEWQVSLDGASDFDAAMAPVLLPAADVSIQVSAR